ncbi:MAG: hypothetical protein IJT34_03155 [Butyrivibrio sp.]|nr:hypothetical protein [Butyrivibrio sp.]
MSRILSQKEIDALVEALHAVRNSGDTGQINDDRMNDQTVLSQSEIDALIETLRGSYAESSSTDMTGILSQGEIDHLIEALNVINNFDAADGAAGDLFSGQTVLSQDEIDHLISILKAVRGEQD